VRHPNPYALCPDGHSWVQNGGKRRQRCTTCGARVERDSSGKPVIYSSGDADLGGKR
jgi:hypothetical protein